MFLVRWKKDYSLDGGVVLGRVISSIQVGVRDFVYDEKRDWFFDIEGLPIPARYWAKAWPSVRDTPTPPVEWPW